MKPTSYLFAFLVLNIFPTSGVRAESTRFTSRYTDLSKDCTWVYKEEELEEGQDNAITCTGQGGYRLSIDFSASDSWLTVQHLDNPKYSSGWSISIPNYEKGMIEWRMANDRPFAVIARSRSPVGSDEKGEVEFLEVRGLGSYEVIKHSVNANIGPRANEEARRLAELSFNKLSGPR